MWKCNFVASEHVAGGRVQIAPRRLKGNVVTALFQLCIIMCKRARGHICGCEYACVCVGCARARVCKYLRQIRLTYSTQNLNHA